jgi:hypothetical protein
MHRRLVLDRQHKQLLLLKKHPSHSKLRDTFSTLFVHIGGKVFSLSLAFMCPQVRKFAWLVPVLWNVCVVKFSVCFVTVDNGTYTRRIIFCREQICLPKLVTELSLFQTYPPISFFLFW